MTDRDSKDDAADQRSLTRLAVGWTAYCTDGEQRWDGVVLDITPRGGFFAQSPASAAPLLGRELRLVLDVSEESGRGGAPASLQVVVRWIGHSPTHRADGWGFEIVVAAP